jgi:hypothetical protein
MEKFNPLGLRGFLVAHATIPSSVVAVNARFGASARALECFDPNADDEVLLRAKEPQ